MKTSSGLLLGVLFTLVVVIVAVVIYFNTRPEEEEKPETLDGPTLPGISDLNVSRTDSPDSDSETYTIEPYTIEYAEGDNERALSKNITFTLNWTNNDGFDDVTGIKVLHYINTTDNAFTLHDTATKSDQSEPLRTSFKNVSFSVTGDGTYSFVGKNRFKILAVLNRKVTGSTTEFQTVTLYDGRYEDDGITVKIIPGNPLDIKEEDLTATIGMALALTKKFELELQDETKPGSNATLKEISNTKYTFKAVPYKFDSPEQGTDVDDGKKVEYTNVELIAQDTVGQKFKFRKLGTQQYWGLTNVSASEENEFVGDPYKLLKTDSTEGNAATIIFANSSKGDEYRSFKIVAGTEAVPIDMYLFGIKGTVAFRTLGDPVVSKSYKLSNTRHWKITKQT
jgi:hypothetical protein